MIKKIVILGGGTAGWMAANILAKRWAKYSVEIALVESSDIGIIGVGEGSTPQLKSFFDYMEIAEAEWMPACNATYKTGIRFCNWSTKPGFENYFHPFPAQPDDYSAPAFFYNCFVRRKGADVYAHPDKFFLATYLAKHQLGPKPAHHFPFQLGYGYHFDSSLVGLFLKQHAAKLGVAHIDARITEVKLDAQGYISHLLTENQQPLAADLFIDCSGFAGVLIQQALKVPFINFSSNLFNDSAVVMPTSAAMDIAPQTTATALNAGWMWNIPLVNRIGNGYVYSSNYLSADMAETELRQKLNLLDKDVPVRHLKMKVGRLQHHWAKNCLAVGLSQGFIEPLEATALHLVQETVLGFAEAIELGDFTDREQANFNRSINQRFEAVRDYIVCHYRVNSRTDTQYWRDNANNNSLSDSLRELLQVWVGGGNLTQEIERQKIGCYYPSASWHCLLAGYGLFPTQDQLLPGNEVAHKYKMENIENFISRCALNFSSHREQLNDLVAKQQVM